MLENRSERGTDDGDAAKKTHAIGEEILETAKAVKKK